MRCFLALLFSGFLLLGAQEPIALADEAPNVAADPWKPGDPTPQGVVELLGFDPATVPSAPIKLTPIQAAIFAEAEQAYENADYDRAKQLWMNLADQDVAAAQFWIGVLFDKGHLGKIDPKMAKEWFSESAKNGYPQGLFNLGVFYSFDDRHEKNYTLSAVVFSKAAEMGLDKAKVNLGLLLMGGYGLKRSPIEAYKWFYLAGSEGVPEVQKFKRFTSAEEREAGRRAAGLSND